MSLPKVPFLLSSVVAACLAAGLLAAGGDGDDGPLPTTLRGEALVAGLGCGACHAGLPDPLPAREAAPPLGPGGRSLPPEVVFAYLESRPGPLPGPGPSRMPDFRLDEGERLALAYFLGGPPTPGGPLDDARRRNPEAGPERGEALFRALGCAGCHAHPAVAAWENGPDLGAVGSRLDAGWLRGFLEAPVPVRPNGTEPGSGSRMPDFRLTAGEVEALTGYLLALRGGASPPAAALPRLSAVQMRNTEAFVRGRLACLGCHVMAGEGGAVGPPLDGVQERLTPEAVLALLRDPQAAAPGSVMPRPPLGPGDAERVAAFLLQRGGSWAAPPGRSLSAAPPRLPPAALAVPGGDGAGAGPLPATDFPASAPPDGARLYGRYCAFCHGDAGRADGWNASTMDARPTAHADAGLMAARADDTLFDGIHGGGWVLDRSARMPAYGETLSSGEIRALVAYIRALCQCQGPPWSRPPGGG